MSGFTVGFIYEQVECRVQCVFNVLFNVVLCSGGNSVSEVGGAKLHEFPTTLHRFARFTIAYCFTKTTLGQHIEDAIQHATR